MDIFLYWLRAADKVSYIAAAVFIRPFKSYREYYLSTIRKKKKYWPTWLSCHVPSLTVIRWPSSLIESMHVSQMNIRLKWKDKRERLTYAHVFVSTSNICMIFSKTKWTSATMAMSKSNVFSSASNNWRWWIRPSNLPWDPVNIFSCHDSSK